MQKSMIKLISIADVISLINALFGFLAILCIFSNKTRLAFSFILLALLADGLDGIVARKTKKGELGEYMEAMADMLSLGIAPAFFVYNIYYNIASENIFYHGLLILSLIIYLSLSIIRLASFHIIKNDDFFVGLPASASTIFIIIFSFLNLDFFYILLVILIISIVMVSPIKFPKIGLKINLIAALLIILTIILGNNFYNIMPILLIMAIAIYTISGPFYLRKKLS